MESLYEHAGGRESLRHFVDVFYTSVLADPLLEPLFHPLREVPRWQWVATAGD